MDCEDGEASRPQNTSPRSKAPKIGMPFIFSIAIETQATL